MSDPSRLARRALVLALAVLLLTDAAALPAGPRALAALPAEAPAETAAPVAESSAEAVPGSGSETICAPGFDNTDTRVGLSLMGVTRTGRGTMAVGFSRINSGDEVGTRRPVAIFRDRGEWERIAAASGGREDGLVAVTSAGGDRAWAVGFSEMGLGTLPLAMYWNGERWSVHNPPPRSLTTVLTDVAMVGSWPFAVGYRLTPSGGSLPVAARREGRRWRYVSPPTHRRESVTLTGVSSDRHGGFWVVGYGGRGTRIQPVIYQRARNGWTRQRTPTVRAEGVITDVVAGAPDDAWAVGYRRTGTRTEPLVLHWDGRAWRRAEAPDFASNEAVLTAVSTSPSGGIWAVGAAWDGSTLSHRAVAAWWDGRAWDPVSAIAAATELHDVTGSPDSSGWAVGRSGLRSLVAQVCLPAGSGVFGSYEDSAPDPGDAQQDLATSATTRAAQVEPATAAAGGGPSEAGGRSASEAQAATQRLAAPGRRTQRRRDTRRQASRERRQRIPGLPSARADSRILARDVAARVGIGEMTVSYGAVVADFDGDGADDLFIGRHGRPGRLVLNRGGRFVDHEAVSFPPLDRHGCAAADVDGSGLPDLYCTIGGKRGSGLKSDELWLDPGGPAPVQAAIERGLTDPTARGRRAAFLQSAGSPRMDLVVANSPVRVDGLPSVGRLYRSDGDGTFKARVHTGFASLLGSIAMQDADFDADGDEDLLLVTGGWQSPRQLGMRLYRNTEAGLVDVTRRMGIRDIDDVDAELLDINGDGDLDLAQLSPTRLRVSVQRSGRFQPVYERRLSYGRALGGGDANGDGRDDLYLVRGNGTRNHADVMLLNSDSGRDWASIFIPQTDRGVGEDAVAVDHDGNGLEDFLVLNGYNERGPVQLIAFFERPR